MNLKAAVNLRFDCSYVLNTLGVCDNGDSLLFALRHICYVLLQNRFKNEIFYTHDDKSSHGII